MDHEISDHLTLKSAIDGLDSFLRAQGVADEKIFDAKLAARELIENALCHAGENASLSCRLEGGFIELTVRSSSSYRPTEITCSGVYDEHGRGLFLIESVSHSVTVEEDLTKILIKL